MQILSHEEDFINGLNIAYDVLCLGQSSRQAFIDVLVRQVGMKKAWFRDLVTELQHVPYGGTAL